MACRTRILPHWRTTWPTFPEVILPSSGIGPLFPVPPACDALNSPDHTMPLSTCSVAARLRIGLALIARASADLIRQAQGHALAGVALRSTPSASVTTIRRPARPGRARLLLPGESVSNAHRAVRVGPALAAPWGDAQRRLGLPVGLQFPASAPLHSVERQFTGFHEGARRPSAAGTRNSAYSRAVPFTPNDCRDSLIPCLPRLGSRVRIPSPAPVSL